MTAAINQIIAGTYPGGDTSQTQQLRATYSGTLALADNTETLVPLFTTVENTNINMSATDVNTLLTSKTGVITGALELNVFTTGANVQFSVWLEYSVNGGSTWQPVPGSLRQSTIATDATVNAGSTLIGNVFAGALTRCRVKRVGGTTCTIAPVTLTTATGNVTQYSSLFRVYGI